MTAGMRHEPRFAAVPKPTKSTNTTSRCAANANGVASLTVLPSITRPSPDDVKAAALPVLAHFRRRSC